MRDALMLSSGFSTFKSLCCSRSTPSLFERVKVCPAVLPPPSIPWRCAVSFSRTFLRCPSFLYGTLPRLVVSLASSALRLHEGFWFTGSVAGATAQFCGNASATRLKLPLPSVLLALVVEFRSCLELVQLGRTPFLYTGLSRLLSRYFPDALLLPVVL